MAYLIAEIGVNHQGSLDIARKMVEQARWCGADAVKFQTFWHFPDLKHLELGRGEFLALFEHCKTLGIEVFSTPFSRDAIDFLLRIGQTTWKILSGMITNGRYLKWIPQGNRIISTGMASMDEVVRAVQTIGTDNLTVLHCTTAYPARYGDVNLNAMKTIREKLNVPVGLSDHTKGIEIPIAAVAMGATVIEKHFTLDKGLPGPDHQASLEPAELKNGRGNPQRGKGNGNRRKGTDKNRVIPP